MRIVNNLAETSFNCTIIKIQIKMSFVKLQIKLSREDVFRDIFIAQIVNIDGMNPAFLFVLIIFEGMILLTQQIITCFFNLT